MAERGNDQTVSENPFPSGYIPGLTEAIALAILGKAGGDVVSGGVRWAAASALPLASRKEVIACRILASWFEETRYCIAIEFLNLTMHGAYLEEMKISKPSDMEFDLSGVVASASNPSGVISGPDPKHDWLASGTKLPLYLPALGSLELVVGLKDNDALKDDASAQLLYRFAVADGTEVGLLHKNETKINALLRRRGPNFRKP
jgi:hypothetical protein